MSCSNFKNYDGFIRDHDLSFGLNLFYTLMVKTFDSQQIENLTNLEKYKLSWYFDSNSLSLTFLTTFDEFFPLTQTIYLKENIMSEDKTITLKINQIELKYQEEINEINKLKQQIKNIKENEIDKLKQQIKSLEDIEIIFAYHYTLYE